MQESYQYHMNTYFPIMPNQLLIPQFGHYQPNPFQYTFLNPNQYFPIQEFQQNTDIFKIVEINEKKEDNKQKEQVKCSKSNENIKKSLGPSLKKAIDFISQGIDNNIIYIP